MMCSVRGQVYILLLIVLIQQFLTVQTLKCNEDNLSDDDIKDSIRSCIRKFSINQNDDDEGSDTGPFGGYNSPNGSGLREVDGTSRYQYNQNGAGKRLLLSGRRQDNNSDTQRRLQNSQECIAHCFFKNLNMLNNQEFPDKQKLLHVLAKDIRNKELRDFLSDTIQECFRFASMEYRRDKCKFSKAVIDCIVNYARINCEDWNGHINVLKQ